MAPKTSIWLIFTALTLSSAFLASCIDPVHNERVADLGDEAPGVRRGPTHRPGQPCMTCHGGLGPGPDFEIAGTVFETETAATPAKGAVVTLKDATGATQTISTNTAGNFYISQGSYTPTYPLHVQVDGKPMKTTIGRRGGCADCHRGGGSQYLMPQVSK